MNVSVDLSNFYSDYRKSSLVYIDLKKAAVVSDFLSYVCHLFKLDELPKRGIYSKISIFAENFFIHPEQPIDILKNIQSVRLVRTDCDNNDVDFTIDETTNDIPHKRKSKKKKKLFSKIANGTTESDCNHEIDENRCESDSTRRKSKKNKKKVSTSTDMCDKDEFDDTVKITNGLESSVHKIELTDIVVEENNSHRSKKGKKRKDTDNETFEMLEINENNNGEQQEWEKKPKKKKKYEIKKNEEATKETRSYVENFDEHFGKSTDDNQGASTSSAKQDIPDNWHVNNLSKVEGLPSKSSEKDSCSDITFGENFSETNSIDTLNSSITDFSIPLKKTRKRRHKNKNFRKKQKLLKKSYEYKYNSETAAVFKSKVRPTFSDTINTNHIYFSGDEKELDKSEKHNGKDEHMEVSSLKWNVEDVTKNIIHNQNLSPKHSIEDVTLSTVDEQNLNIKSSNLNIFNSLENLELNEKCTYYEIKNRFNSIKPIVYDPAPRVNEQKKSLPDPPNPLRQKIILSDESKMKFSQLLALECLSSPLSYSRGEKIGSTSIVSLNATHNESSFGSPLCNSTELPISFSSNRLKNASKSRGKKYSFLPRNVTQFNPSPQIKEVENPDISGSAVNIESVSEPKTEVNGHESEEPEQNLTGFVPKRKTQRTFNSLGNFLALLKGISSKDEVGQNSQNKPIAEKDENDANSVIEEIDVPTKENINPNKRNTYERLSVEEVSEICEDKNDISLIKNESDPNLDVLQLSEICEDKRDISLVKDESSPCLNVPEVMLNDSSSDEADSIEMIKKTAERDKNLSKVPEISIENPNNPKILPSCKDLSTYPLMKYLPKCNDIIAFKLVTVDKSFCPKLSDYRPAKVLAVKGLTVKMRYLDNSNTKESNVDGEQLIDITCEEEIEIDWRNINAPRLVFP